MGNTRRKPEDKKRRVRPATTPEQRENQLIGRVSTVCTQIDAILAVLRTNGIIASS